MHHKSWLVREDASPQYMDKSSCKSFKVSQDEKFKLDTYVPTHLIASK